MSYFGYCRMWALTCTHWCHYGWNGWLLRLHIRTELDHPPVAKPENLTIIILFSLGTCRMVYRSYD